MNKNIGVFPPPRPSAFLYIFDSLRSIRIYVQRRVFYQKNTFIKKDWQMHCKPFLLRAFKKNPPFSDCNRE